MSGVTGAEPSGASPPVTDTHREHDRSGAGPAAPRVTVALCVHDEQRWIESAIESLLAQTHRDFELLIMDNASTDGTSEIAERYAREHDRIRHVRHETNLGAIANYARAVREARGEYFLLAAGHDLFSENYIERLLPALEADRRAVLAFGRTAWIDESGLPVEGGDRLHLDMSGVSSPVARFNLVMWWHQNALYGLMRTEAVRKTHLDLEVLGTGAVALGELAILGRILHVPEVTWHRRLNRAPEDHDARVQRYLTVLYRKPRRRFLPNWRIPWAFLRCVLTIELPQRHRLRTRFLLVLSCTSAVVRYWRLMADDVRWWRRRRRKAESLKA
jgi:glycosyltransferase involved in cell wall biosynthesis